MDPTDRKKIGKYDITGILGRGGMGVVYRAEDKRIGRQVAIKTLTENFSGQPEMRDRFFKEAQAGFLQHPNIVIVYDMGDEDGVPYIVMEFVPGEPLDKLIDSGRPLSMIDKLTIIEQVCMALGYAHSSGVFHRDIKPANVIVQRDPILAKIVDFGIAKVQGRNAETGLTRTGNVIGTMHYIAPERLKGQRGDGRSDLFATGVMLYLMLTGQLPFSGEDMAVLHKLAHEPHPPLKNWISGYPPQLDGIIDRALAKEPEDRYSTGEEFASDLHSLIEQLKKGQVVELFGDAERLASEQQFGRARDILYELVKIEPSHTQARKLLSEVNQNLAKMQRAEQVRQLVAEAEATLAGSRYPEGLGLLDQALKLDPENREIAARIEQVKETKRRFDEIEALMGQAAGLRQRGDLTGALRVVEKAVEVSGGDTRLRNIHNEISREVRTQAQQEQMKELLGKARQELGSRRFTAAIEILREATKIDPSQAEVDSLMQAAVSGQEQEQRRRIIEQINAEIESALSNGDYERAGDLLDRALEKLPNEGSLLQLKSRVAVELRKLRARQLIDQTVTKAQEIFATSPGEALQLVQKALEELPGEARLVALEDSLRQRLKSAEQEQVRGSYLRDAQKAIDSNQFEKAIEILDSYQLEFGDPEAVKDLLEFARGELQQQQRRARVNSALVEAKRLLEAQQYGQAIQLLEAASAETGDAQVGRLLTEARGQVKEFERKAEALLARIARLREKGQFDEAIELLQPMPAAAAPGTPLNVLLQELRAEKNRKQAVANALGAAAKAVQQAQYQAALDGLQAVERAFGEQAEIRSAVKEVEGRRREHADQILAKSVEAAREALLASDAAKAVQELKNSAEFVEFASQTQQADWQRLKTEATKPQARKTTGNVALAGLEVSHEQEKKSKLPLILGAAAVVVVGGVVAFFVMGKGGKPEQQTSTVTAPAGPTVVLPPSGTVVIQGSPGGANVFVDGVLKGFTQNDGSLKLPLDPGTHSLRFSKPGFNDLNGVSVTVADKDQKPLTYTLQQAAPGTVQAPLDAYLAIHSTPGATVSVDGAAQGKTDARGDLVLTVKPNAKTLAFALDGYQPYSQPLSVKAGEHSSATVMLTPIPVAAKPQPAAAPAAEAAQILSFNASASQIEQGQSVTLHWETAKATEVSIDNGIGRVDPSGNTTVKPGANTTYTLTAKGAGGSQQRPLNVLVEAKAAAAPAVVNQPAPAAAVDQTALVLGAINSYSAAFNAHDVGKMQALWTGMSSGQAKGLTGFFKDNPTAKVVENCPANQLSVGGDSADANCTETTSFMASGKMVSTPHAAHFHLARKGGSWTITDKR